MPTRRRSTLSLGILGFALSACATIPAGPPKEAREIPTIESSLLEALRKNEGEAKRFEQDGRLR